MTTHTDTHYPPRYPLEICGDCLIIIANGEVPDHMNQEQYATFEARTREYGHLSADGTDTGFTHARCDLCDALPGDRYRAYAAMMSEPDQEDAIEPAINAGAELHPAPMELTDATQPETTPLTCIITNARDTITYAAKMLTYETNQTADHQEWLLKLIQTSADNIGVAHLYATTDYGRLQVACIGHLLQWPAGLTKHLAMFGIPTPRNWRLHS